MATETFVAVQRPKGTPVAGLGQVPVRIVEKTIMVQNGNGGATPYTLINLFSREGVPDIRTGDYIIDTVNGPAYRASGVPVAHDVSYLSIQLTRYAETTP